MESASSTRKLHFHIVLSKQNPHHFYTPFHNKSLYNQSSPLSFPAYFFFPCLEMNSEAYEKKPICVGPWGGSDGDRWDDGVYSNIRQLVISHAAGIDSIQIEYDRNGCSVWSSKHGGMGGKKTDKIKIDIPDEFLISISGHYGSINDWSPTFIRSIAFQSNRRVYGPYGVQQGTHFTFLIEGKHIIGFHGRSGWYLDAIGAYMKPIQKSREFKVVPSSQSFVTNGTNNQVGYNLVQGSVGNGYDIVVALRQQDDYSRMNSNTLSKTNTSSKANTLSKQSSSSSNSSGEEESNYKELSFPSKNGNSNGESGAVSYGPWGGNGGTVFDDGVYTGVRQVNLTRSGSIISIRVFYDQNGKHVWGNRHGGTGSFKSDKVLFDYPFEILTHISGYYGPLMYMGPNVIRSLTFHTTKKKYGPYGDEQGTPFNSNLKAGVVVGFFGKTGWFLDSIGVHSIEGKIISTSEDAISRNISNSKDIVQSKNELQVSEMDNPQWSNKLVLARKGPNEEVSCGVVKEPAPCGPGPWGGDGGRPWDDGVFTGIRQIFLTRNEVICSIQIEYDRTGQSVWSVRHGSNGDTTHKIKFEYPHEVISCVSGYYGPIYRDDRLKVIQSLTFYTSRGKYGPFGEEIGTFFTSTTTEGKVVGFHGKSSLYLDAIGVHMQHWMGNQRRSAKSKFTKMFG